jgi:ribosomal protein S27AE
MENLNKVTPVTKIPRMYKPKKKLKENEKECPICHSVFVPENKYELVCFACEFDSRN